MIYVQPDMHPGRISPVMGSYDTVETENQKVWGWKVMLFHYQQDQLLQQGIWFGYVSKIYVRV